MYNPSLMTRPSASTVTPSHSPIGASVAHLAFFFQRAPPVSPEREQRIANLLERVSRLREIGRRQRGWATNGRWESTVEEAASPAA